MELICQVKGRRWKGLDVIDKCVFLIIGGGIVVYKLLELICEFLCCFIVLCCILIWVGFEFVILLSLFVLFGDKVYGEFFDFMDEVEMGYIELFCLVDLVVVFLVIVDLMVKVVNGLVNDLVLIILLVIDKLVLMVLVMNVCMWEYKVIQCNLVMFKGDGVYFVGLDEGDMVCGEFGLGCLVELFVIVDVIEVLLND